MCKVSTWDPGRISLLVYFAFSSLKFCVKVYNRKSKMYYKWDLGGIPHCGIVKVVNLSMDVVNLNFYHKLNELLILPLICLQAFGFDT
jgi:hypothetical protein